MLILFGRPVQQAEKHSGRLNGYHADLCGAVIDDLVNKVGIDGNHVDDVVMGRGSQVGSLNQATWSVWW